MQHSAQIPGREEISLVVELSPEGLITSTKVTAIGSWDFLRLVQDFRKKLKGNIKDLQLPQGPSTGAMLIREVLLKAQGRWQPPYDEIELCHCRAVTTQAVDLAILAGALTPRQVSAQTSASTACGTCRPNVEAIIAYRMGS